MNSYFVNASGGTRLASETNLEYLITRAIIVKADRQKIRDDFSRSIPRSRKHLWVLNAYQTEIRAHESAICKTVSLGESSEK